MEYIGRDKLVVMADSYPRALHSVSQCCVEIGADDSQPCSYFVPAGGHDTTEQHGGLH